MFYRTTRAMLFNIPAMNDDRTFNQIVIVIWFSETDFISENFQKFRDHSHVLCILNLIPFGQLKVLYEFTFVVLKRGMALVKPSFQQQRIQLTILTSNVLTV